MLSRYHIEITRKSLGSFFSAASLREIARANVRQDSLPSLLGMEARRHVCDCTVAESLAYVDEEHERIGQLAQRGESAALQRAAFGRLLHTVQDFYAHTNYVALLMAKQGAAVSLDVSAMKRLDPEILSHPALQIAQWLTWRDPIYYIPLVGDVLRHLWLPAGSHEAINLDSPKRGANFHVAFAFARQRTQVEYARTLATLRELGGQEAVAQFHGAMAYITNAAPLKA